MLGISTSGGVGFTAKVHPHRYGYVGRLVAQNAKRIPCRVSEEDRERIGLKLERGEMEDVLEDIRLSEAGVHLTLDKRSKSQQHPRARTGSKGMSRATRHTVRGSIVALASVCPDSTMSFFTATCPPIDYQTDGYTASNWHKVVNVFLQRLRRRLEAAGLPKQYVYVTEIQEKRFDSSGYPYLHLHLVFRGRENRYKGWVATRHDLQLDWVQSLNTLYEDGPYYLAICDLKACDEGVAKYLSKYLSKGATLVDRAVRLGYGHWMPKQWWGCSREVVAEREALTYRARGVEAHNMWDLMRTGGHNHVEWVYPVRVEDARGAEYIVGYVFALTEAAYIDLIADGRLKPDLSAV